MAMRTRSYSGSIYHAFPLVFLFSPSLIERRAATPVDMVDHQTFVTAISGCTRCHLRVILGNGLPGNDPCWTMDFPDIIRFQILRASTTQSDPGRVQDVRVEL